MSFVVYVEIKQCKVFKRNKFVLHDSPKVNVVFEEKVFSGNNNVKLPVGCYCDHLTHRTGSVGLVFLKIKCINYIRKLKLLFARNFNYKVIH